ncbi:hypothetical protein RHGRI_008012 [Rhododendron griersonianum]|uniref:Transmembrane protein n=1 Tax=Rhododendron griersonianum TaxID=479676 RepID=A0AAV6KYP8_9ERIC|nr:hypothetical protein RHGRI_008012 [Rhododendron griersonianum]
MHPEPSILSRHCYITALGLFSSTLVVVVSVAYDGAKNGGVGFHGNGKAMLAYPPALFDYQKKKKKSNASQRRYTNLR